MNNTKITTNTHDYDTRIKPLYKQYIEEDDELLIEPISFEETIKEIKEEINKCTLDLIKGHALNTINIIERDNGIPNSQNYDNLNDIYIEDLLRRTWRFIKHYCDDSRGFFIEQLADITTSGSCSQGRITRVYQFYSFHMMQKDEIFNKCKKKIIL